MNVSSNKNSEIMIPEIQSLFSIGMQEICLSMHLSLDLIFLGESYES
jgi:hypothetical protein